MTDYHDRASGPPRPFLPPPPGQPESELQATAREVLTELGYVWLGDFSGWEVGIMRRHDHDGGDTLCLYHRCGWAQPLAPCGIQNDHGVYVGNMLERLGEILPGHVCAPHEPSPEHQARVARWAAAAGVTPSGDVAQDQLGIVRALSRRPKPEGD